MFSATHQFFPFGFWHAFRQLACGLLAASAGLACAADQVLIMTVSAYRTTPLPGVRHDAANARALAARLGFDVSRAQVPAESVLTASGLLARLDELVRATRPNDRVFLYFSGHGTGRLQNGTCRAGWLGIDMASASIGDVSVRLAVLKQTASEVLVVVDASHSGGAGKPRLAAKSAAVPGADSCEPATGFGAAAAAYGFSAGGASNPDNNLTIFTAARAREAALDDESKGGLATTSLLRCAETGVQAEGIVTARDLAACAQSIAAAETARLQWTPQTIEADGNHARPVAQVASIRRGLVRTDAGLAQRVVRRFESFLAGANGNWSLEVTPSATLVPLGAPDWQREISFRHRGAHEGYGYVLYVGTDGVDMQQIHPEPGRTLRLPAQGNFGGLQLRVDPPAGDNTFLFVVSREPLNLGGLFAEAQSASGTAAEVAIQCEMSQRNVVKVGDGTQCGAKRNLVAAENAAAGHEGYAAVMVRVRGR